jgi:shikimate dehydrogenase
MKKRFQRRACVIGWPIAHSRSHIIHNYWLRTYDLEGTYERIAVPPGEFLQFTARVGVEGLQGGNVTLPHKEAAFAASDRLTDAARAIGAVNTIWRDGEALCGDNTDAFGFLANLDADAPGWRTEVKTAVVLGSGGAARAIGFALLLAGVERIRLHNRTFERAQRLATTLGAKFAAASWAASGTSLPEADLVVNATSLGMQGQRPLDVDLESLKPTAIVADLVYVPLQTALIEEAATRGHRVVTGLGMLLHQAVPGFERWFGLRPAVTPELRAAVEADLRAQEMSA